MGFENAFGNNPTSHAERAERVKTIEIILKDPEKRPDPNSFKEMYGADVVRSDNEEVARLDSIFSKAEIGESADKAMGRKLSAAFETLIRVWATKFGWFGDKTEVASTSKFDDYINKVDAVLVLPGEGYVALAIDVSRNTDLNKLTEKLALAHDKVMGRAPSAKVKYFQHHNLKGQLEGIVPVVLGIDGNDCEALIDTFGQIVTLLKQTKRTDRQNEILKEKLTLMREHPVQRVLLEEIMMQLRSYKHQLSKPDTGYTPNVTIEGVELIQGIISRILQQKGDIELGDYESDGVYRHIKDFTQFRS